MKVKIFLYRIALLTGIISTMACEKELNLDLPVTSSKLVVEGWIENGRNIEIILSHSAPYFSAIDSENISQFVETRAKVTVFSDNDSEILTLKPNDSYFPPYVYKSVAMQGEAGKTYSLEIISNGDTIKANTTIPQPVELDSVWFKTDAGETTKGRLWIRLTDDPVKENYYRLMYKRKGKDNMYISANISTFSDVLINGRTTEMGFLRGISDITSMDNDNYFEVGDTISVKFCTIDEEQFNFWNVYQSKMLASANPLATSNHQLKSNVNGGLGIWTGYGATYYLLYAK
jgi:hypothetical protein